ncbi:MAG: zinc ABC transporter substrate-binding protein [Bacteroidota bacterium]|nr:zinc ABC transporter substrate-binding protein [Bacteroidota bacterium]
MKTHHVLTMKILIGILLLNAPLILQSQQKLRVLATASMWFDMAQAIGGELISVDLIVPVGSDPHMYEATPSDVTKVIQTDVILMNGMTFEGWLGKLIENSGTKAKIYQITEGIIPITNPEHNNAMDPHAWMDASNGLIYVGNILKSLIENDPIHEKEYRFNYGIYKKELEDLHKYVQEKILLIPKHRRILITSHDAFHYFGKKYDIQLESLLGTSTDADVQSADLIRINQLIKTRNIPAIFIESTVNPKLIQQLQIENRIEIGGSLYADSLGDELSPASTYIKMLKHNADIISSALSKDPTNNKTVLGKLNKGRWVYIGLAIFYCSLFIALILINRKS